MWSAASVIRRSCTLRPNAVKHSEKRWKGEREPHASQALWTDAWTSVHKMWDGDFWEQDPINIDPVKELAPQQLHPRNCRVVTSALAG